MVVKLRRFVHANGYSRIEFSRSRVHTTRLWLPRAKPLQSFEHWLVKRDLMRGLPAGRVKVTGAVASRDLCFHDREYRVHELCSPSSLDLRTRFLSNTNHQPETTYYSSIRRYSPFTR